MQLSHIKRLLLGLLGCLFFLLLSTAQAIPIFKITTSNTTLNLAAGQTATVTYLVENNSGIDFFDMRYSRPPLTWYTPGSSCSNTLAKGASCNLLLTVQAPNVVAPSHILLEPLHVCGNSTTSTYNGITCSVANKDNRVQLNIVSEPTQGHFVFRDGGGADITTLDLVPNDSSTVTLNNTGGSTITSLSVTIPAAISSYFSGTCTTETSLAPGASCTLTYTIPLVPVSGSYNIVATGTDADNSPHTLAVDVRSFKAFVTGGTNLGIYQCLVNPATGAFSNCSTSNRPTSTPGGVAFNPAGTQIFFVNISTNILSRCNVDPITGFLGFCSGTPQSEDIGEETRDFVFNSAGTIAYITGYLSNSVYRCDVNPTTGVFSNCSSTNITVSAPVGILLNAAGTKIFIANYNGSSPGYITQCDVNPTTGALTNCADAGATGLDSPYDIAFNPTETKVFITDSVLNTVRQCDVNHTTGALSNCSDSGVTGLNSPRGIALNATGTKIFIGNDGSDQIVQCDMNSTTGTASNCSDTGATGITDPRNLVFQGY